jgi:hypothetical protein
MRAIKRLSVAVLTLTVTASAALGQDSQQGERGDTPPGPARERPNPGMRAGAQLSLERAKAAWQAQATFVAGEVGLDNEQSQALTKAYVEARERHRTEDEKIRREFREKMISGDENQNGEGDGFNNRRELAMKMHSATSDLLTTHRKQFEATLGSVLGKEHAPKAVKVIGNFEPMWDRLVDALANLKLEAVKMKQAMSATNTYVLAVAKARQSEDRAAVRGAIQDASRDLDEALEGVLSEEQLAQFREAALGGGERGMRRGPGERRRSGGADAPGGPPQAPPVDEEPPAEDGNS